MEGDWRLEHLRTQPFLRGACFQRTLYKTNHPDWDHDHCAGCWAKFAENASEPELIEQEGYATTSNYEKGAGYDWVCVTCFALFKDEMGWIEVRN